MIITQENTWINGENQDLAKSEFRHDQYYKGRNIRLLTKVGLSTGNICNEEGTLSSFKMPSSVARLYSVSLVTGGTVGTLTINGQSVGSVTASSTIDTLFSSVESSTTTPVANGDFAVFNNGDSIAVVGLDEDLSVSATGSMISVTLVVERQVNIRIIGWTYLLDDVIIFTKSYDLALGDALASVSPEVTDSPGQVWKLEVDSADGSISGLVDETLVPSTHLIYNNDMHFSWAGRVKGWSNYETPDVAKVYFTDTINNFRHINISDPNLLGYPLSRIEIVPEVDFANIEIQEVKHGGAYNTGMVQYSYCLFNLYGAQSSYSPVTNLIHLVPTSEDTEGYKYMGGAVDESTGKSVAIKIGEALDVIDRRFQYIRVVAIYIDSIYATPTVGIVTEVPIPSTGVAYITDSGEYKGTITHNEFLILGTFNFVCNDVAVKDNILFVSNLEEERFQTDWDARAYRFKSSSPPVAKIEDISGTAIYVNSSFANSSSGEEIPETHDCKVSKDDQQTYKFKSNGTTLGAEGSNIEIEFITEDLVIDTKVPIGDGSTIAGGSASSDPFIAIFTAPTSQSMAGPVNSVRYTGYMRDEVYRFFIVLKNNKGLKSYSKWICDIKMPTAAELEVQTGKNTMYIDNITHYGSNLGLRFKVRNLPDDVASYEILRCERKVEDKSILAQGLYQASIEKTGTGKRCAVSADRPISSTFNHRLGNFISPETIIDRNIESSGADSVELIATYAFGYRCGESDPANPGGAGVVIRKCQETDSVTKQTRTVEETQMVTPGAYTEYLIGPFTYINYAWNGTMSIGYRCTNLLVLLDSAFTINAEINNKIALFNYVRNNDDSRYGGSSYSARSYNTPIPCGATSTEENVWLNVFGGDTFIDIFDCISNVHDLSNPAVGGSKVTYIPVETSIHLALRHSMSFNRMYGVANRMYMQETAGYHAFNGDSSMSVTQPTDLFLYNSVYSRQSNLQPSFMQPLLASDNTSFEARITSSLVKINGQTEDSWTKFGVAAILDVEGRYGGITSLINFNEFLMFFQETAFGVLSVNQKALQIPDETGVSLTLGKGGVLDDYRYISRGSGCIHRFVPQVIHFPEDTLHFYDYHANKLLSYTTSKSRLARNDLLPLSALEGMSSYLNNMDRTYLKYDQTFNDWGVHSTVDHENNRILYTFLSGPSKYTLAYNTLLSAFEGEFDFMPSAYLSKGKFVYSCIAVSGYSNKQTGWLHGAGNRGEFYGVYCDSLISWVVNTLDEYSKLYNTLHYGLNVTNPDGTDDWDRNFDIIKAYNEYQDSGEVSLVYGTNCNRLFRVWRCKIPRPLPVSSLARLRSQTAIIELQFINDSNNQKFQLEKMLTKMTVR